MKKTRHLAQAAVIAALYTALTYLSHIAGAASGAVQLRLSEALTVLPFFTSAAVPGLAAGCLVANLLTGCALWDLVFGTLATLLGAVGTRLLRRKSPALAPLPPIAANTAIVPLVLREVYGLQTAFPLLLLGVFAGEVLSCGCLGLALLYVLKRRAPDIFS